jgi:hypothetical protein
MGREFALPFDRALALTAADTYENQEAKAGFEFDLKERA